MHRIKALASLFMVLAIALAGLAAGVTSATAQVAPAAIGSAVDGGQAAYSITARGQDICIAAYLLDDQGYLHFLRYRLVQAFQTVGVVTGTFVPVFVTYQPVGAAFPVQRCSGGPNAGNLITDVTALPQIYVVFAPRGVVADIDVNNTNFASIIQIARQATILGAVQNNACALSNCTNASVIQQLQAQFAAIFQSNSNTNNVNIAVGFGGFEVDFDSTQLLALLNKQATCGAAYSQNGGTGNTCSPPLQGGGSFSSQSF